MGAVCVKVKEIAIGAEGLGFDSRAGQMWTQYRQSLTTAAMFLQSCVIQVLSGQDGPHHSLHTSAKYRKYNEKFVDTIENLLKLKKIKFFHYSRWITSKRVTSGRVHLRGIEPGLHSFEETSLR